MARITMRNSQKATFAEVFEIYILYVQNFGYRTSTLFRKYRNKKEIALFGEKIIPSNNVFQSVIC